MKELLLIIFLLFVGITGIIGVIWPEKVTSFHKKRGYNESWILGGALYATVMRTRITSTALLVMALFILAINMFGG